MNKYDIFKSEGGYRICLAVLNGCPVVGTSPWFESEKQAKQISERYKVRDECYRYANQDILYCSPDFLSGYSEGTAQEQHIRYIFNLSCKQNITAQELKEMKKYIEKMVVGKCWNELTELQQDSLLHKAIPVDARTGNKPTADGECTIDFEDSNYSIAGVWADGEISINGKNKFYKP